MEAAKIDDPPCAMPVSIYIVGFEKNSCKQLCLVEIV